MHIKGYVGSMLKSSLINPNQCRSYDVGLCDDPTDPNRELGIYDPTQDEHVEMEMDGTICYFESYVPTDHEIRLLPSVVISSESYWNPWKVSYNNRTRETMTLESMHETVNISGVNVKANPQQEQVILDDRTNEVDYLNFCLLFRCYLVTSFS